MSLYKFLDVNTLVQTETRRAIYLDQPDNKHTQVYLAWAAEGNVADPADPLPPVDPVAEAATLQARVVDATQARLDAFARTRGYDGILSACTYAASTVPKFAAEGQYCLARRDATWATLYQILAAVQAGQRPVPTGYADIEADLPALEWPAS